MADINGMIAGCRAMTIKCTLSKFVTRLRASKIPVPEPYHNLSSKEEPQSLSESQYSAILDQYSFWLLVSQFSMPGDIVMIETGRPSYGD